MTLKDQGIYKSKIQSTLLRSEDIGKLLLGERNYDAEVANEKLLYKYIFPYLYVDETQTEEKSYLCFEVDTPRTTDFSYKDMVITIWCYCHKGIMKYSKQDYLGTRADILTDMVDRLFNSSRNFGIGRLKLESTDHRFFNAKYYGKQLIYKCTEFNLDKKI